MLEAHANFNQRRLNIIPRSFIPISVFNWVSQRLAAGDEASLQTHHAPSTSGAALSAAGIPPTSMQPAQVGPARRHVAQDHDPALMPSTSQAAAIQSPQPVQPGVGGVPDNDVPDFSEVDESVRQWAGEEIRNAANYIRRNWGQTGDDETARVAAHLALPALANALNREIRITGPNGDDTYLPRSQIRGIPIHIFSDGHHYYAAPLSERGFKPGDLFGVVLFRQPGSGGRETIDTLRNRAATELETNWADYGSRYLKYMSGS